MESDFLSSDSSFPLIFSKRDRKQSRRSLLIRSFPNLWTLHKIACLRQISDSHCRDVEVYLQGHNTL
jgi:hypothetical protein